MKTIFNAVFCVLFLFSTNALANQLVQEKIVDHVSEYGAQTAIDSNGNQGVCFLDTQTNTLKYAYYDGQDWLIETADDDENSGKVVGYRCAIIFDDQDRPHIAYYHLADQELRHSYKSQGVWETVVVDDQTGIDLKLGIFIENYHRLSLAKDSTGLIGLVYYEAFQDDLILAEFDGQDWQIEPVVTGGDVGQFASLSYDTDDNPGVVYQKEVAADDRDLMYIHFDGAEWSEPEVIDDSEPAGFFATLRFDQNEVAHVAYQTSIDQNDQKVKYTNRRGGVWNEPFTIERASFLGDHCQMALTDEGTAHIIYRHYFKSALVPDTHSVKLVTLYFVDRLNPSQISSRTDRVSFAAAPVRDYQGLSVTTDGDDVGFIYVKESANQLGEYSLYAGAIADWSPHIKLIKPRVAQNKAQNDQFELAWLTFKPKPQSQLRFFYWDDQFNEVRIGDTVDEAEGNTYILDTSSLEPGRYTILAKMSSDGFQTSVVSRARTDLIVPQRKRAEPVVGQNDHKRNRAPSAPEPIHVDDSGEGGIKFKVKNSEDEDGDVIQYVIQVCQDQQCANPIYEKAKIDADQGSDTIVEILKDLLGSGTFYWRVKAVDENDESSDWSTPVKFSVDDESSSEEEEETQGTTGSSMTSHAAAGCSIHIDGMGSKNSCYEFIWFLFLLLLIRNKRKLKNSIMMTIK